jgi:hypothetical protein
VTWDRHDLKVAAFAERLLVEFPDWSTSQAVVAAERIIDAAEEMGAEVDRRRERLAFITATRRDLEQLPVLGDAA